MTNTRRRGQRLKVKPAVIQVHNQVRDAQGLHRSNISSFHFGTWGSLESKPGFGVPPWTVAPHPPLHGAGGSQFLSERALAPAPAPWGQPDGAVASFLQWAPVGSFPWTSASKNWTGHKSRDSTRAFHRTECHLVHRCAHASSDRTGRADASRS